MHGILTPGADTTYTAVYRARVGDPGDPGDPGGPPPVETAWVTARSALF